MRLFIAVDLPRDIILNLLQYINQVQGLDSLRWLTLDQFHLTLRFLGNQPPEKISLIQNVLAQAAKKQRCFKIKLMSGGVFPHSQRPQVFWVGIEGEKNQLMDLSEIIEMSLGSLEISKPTHPFFPHLTVARIRNEKRSSQVKTDGPQFCKLFSRFESSMFLVDQFHLYQSHLQEKGAFYEILASFPLRPS